MINFQNKNILVSGINNKKSVAYFIAQSLSESKANLYLTTQNNEQFVFAKNSFPNAHIFPCDVTKSDHIQSLGNYFINNSIMLDGFIHSIAFARMNPEFTFEQTPWDNFSEAIRISCFSLMEMSSHLKKSFNRDASVVTISISTTRATSYGFMGPIKAMLNSTIDYLAKSFSQDGQVRFNSIGSGPLKTSASAGIPGYVDNYLFSEQLTLRHKALSTQEVANTALFLLSPLSSGINATQITVDAGMSVNYFDEKVVKSFGDQNK